MEEEEERFDGYRYRRGAFKIEYPGPRPLPLPRESVVCLSDCRPCMPSCREGATYCG